MEWGRVRVPAASTRLTTRAAVRWETTTMSRRRTSAKGEGGDRPTPTSIDDCRVIELPRIHDARGNLTFVEGGRHVPFEIKRVYYLYDVPGGEARGGHGH